MKMNMNIKPTYIAAFAVIISVALGAYMITNSIDSAENVLVAQLAEQKAIIDQYNMDSQAKLDGLKSDLGTLNDNDKVLFELINTQCLILGLMQEDILALKEVNKTSTRDFVSIKGLTSKVQPRITTA